MDSHFQSAPLVASPSYPNSIAWSEENLVAVASGHLITILNPTLIVGPRGLITLQPNKPFPIGVVKREDLLTACLMPICLSRDIRPCARSISWSHPGHASNSGCLLAVCTTEGRVKLYRPPFCEFSAEWVEVMDISDMLYDYLEGINFGELNVPSAMLPQGKENAGCIKESGCIIEFQDSVSRKDPKHSKMKGSISRLGDNKYTTDQGEEPTYSTDIDAFHQDTNGGLAATESNDELVTTSKEAILNLCSVPKQGSSMEVIDVGSENIYQSSRQRSGGLPSAKGKEDGVLPLITAGQYASRSALLSSLIVAWSPILQLSGNRPLNHISNDCSILAVGGKSGKISFWRFYEPQCYTIEHGGVPVDAMLIGLLQAHSSWITAISWGIYAPSSSEAQLILATGSSDGSVKIWFSDIERLIKSSETSRASFTLFKEVAAVTFVPISTISLVVPVQSVDKVVLAIGKGSGSLEAWTCHISSNKLQFAGAYDAHDQVVTGLTWAFNGCCLYSCSQDNSLRSWVLHESHLYEVPFPSNFNGLSQVSDQCFGLVLSPGELMIAVVRTFDANLLNQMYQARTQKAVVEFFWTGGQLLAIPSKNLDISTEVFSGLSERELMYWEPNILRSLKRCDNVDKILVLWDLLEALQAFKKSAPNFVENVLLKWITGWFSDYQPDLSTEMVLSLANNMLSKISSRKMHLLNIICRRLMLTEVKVNAPNGEQQGFHELNDDGEKVGLWNKLLIDSEAELQERLVAFTFRAVLGRAPCPPSAPAVCTNWFPVGVAQMKQWVVMNSEVVHNQLKLLGSKVGELGCRIHSICEYTMEETCSFCSAPVPFESSEVARCEGSELHGRTSERHRLERCAVSMQLCSVATPLWFCVCCRRWAAKLLPRTFFTVSKSPLDVDYDTQTSPLQEHSKPLCPFCGILLQRLLPDFFLSASPV